MRECTTSQVLSDYSIRTLCLALPEVMVRVDGSLTAARSTAYSFDVRRRSFCLLVAREDPAGKPVPLLVLRAGPQEREALLSIGYPFFASRAGRDRVVVVLTGDTDWEEVRELVTESYPDSRAGKAHRTARLAHAGHRAAFPRKRLMGTISQVGESASARRQSPRSGTVSARAASGAG